MGPDEVRWLDFVLSNERFGMNIRNQVAHGLATSEELNAENADRLVHIVIRIACIRERTIDDENG
ncbi:MAG: DUF4209 domain-containing protein [Chloroflexi bacterium]|nr:DUF4209 domain-containing protein [Chloroflexota bacterium]